MLCTFEIKIALLGNVSAGKTTVMNALFRNRYGEVSMKRTTAGVNYFRISQKSRDGSISDTSDSVNRNLRQKKQGPGDCEHMEELRGADSTLREITEDNRKLRESNQVHEKWFDIELEKNLFEMRKDTKLVIVDIPGINEAGSYSKYTDYVSTKWDDFDCAVIVMDGKQGVNTEDQVFLLKLVKKNLKERKEIPVIILFNKVDDPDDEELVEIVKEAREEIEKIFLESPSSPSTGAFGSPFGAAKFGSPVAASPASAPGSQGLFGKAQSQMPSPFTGFGSPIAASPASNPGYQGLFGSSATAMQFGSSSFQNRTASPFPALSTNYFSPPSHMTGPQSFQVTNRQDGTNTVQMQSITAMPNYENKSFEELRYEHYVIKGVMTPSSPFSPLSLDFPLSSVSKFQPKKYDSLNLAAHPGSADMAKCTPVFIPVSAMHAFIHQCASQMGLEEFCRFFDQSSIEKIGRDQIGRRRWNTLSEEEKARETHEIVTNPDDHKAALGDTRFDEFLTVLGELVGGDIVQRKLIEKQIQVSLRKLEQMDYSLKVDISAQVLLAFTKIKSLYGAATPTELPDDLLKSFWNAYQKLEDISVAKIHNMGPRYVNYLTKPLRELVSFQEVSNQIGWDNTKIISKKMKSLAKRFIGLLLEKEKYYNNSTWLIGKQENSASLWSLSPLAWVRIWGSILLMSYNEHFCKHFGQEKIILEYHLHQAQNKWYSHTRWFNYTEPLTYYNGFECKQHKIRCPCCGFECVICITFSSAELRARAGTRQRSVGNFLIIGEGITVDGDGIKSNIGALVTEFRCSTCKICFIDGLPKERSVCICGQAYPSMAPKNTLTPCTILGDMKHCQACHMKLCQKPKIKQWTQLKYNNELQMLSPDFPLQYHYIAGVDVPESLSDPIHIGHLVHEFCEFMESRRL